MKDIPHILKIRIIADKSYRTELLMKREGLSTEKAEAMVDKIDEERKDWSMKLYGIDTWDSRLYDLVINIGKISIDYAVELICKTAKLSAFQTTGEAIKLMDRLILDATERLEKELQFSPFFEPMRDFPWQKR